MIGKILSGSLLLLSLAFSWGCASAPEQPEHRPKLGIAQNSDGVVTFAISTEKDYIYALYYEDPETRAWKLIPGCENIRGTGGQVEVQKTFKSRGPLPSFTVRHTRVN
ncbi:hypothetical protein [Pontiella agarivorans]|uniref:Lipoprotein n=1 Tax=Pontiella agarivorans TaxID=3038953 RepID=A0ABU5MT96_9BACT|nr:hypothetical protein [Pontiella agarivorans]MDZ8117378.1 hypothetical protein [Pontiella agarivorans]